MNLFNPFKEAIKMANNVLNGNSDSSKKTTKSSNTSKKSNSSIGVNKISTSSINSSTSNKSSISNVTSSNPTNNISKPQSSKVQIVKPSIDVDALVSEKRQYNLLKQNISSIIAYLNASIKNLEDPVELIKTSYTINGAPVDGGNFKIIRQELINKKNMLNTILDEIDKKIIEIDGVI